jgi:hypothetical protein
MEQFVGTKFPWDTLLDLAKNFGLLNATFVTFFFFAHFWIYKLYLGRINDRQKEIDMLAKENREYRDRFLSLLDEKLGTKKLKKR